MSGCCAAASPGTAKVITEESPRGRFDEREEPTQVPLVDSTTHPSVRSLFPSIRLPSSSVKEQKKIRSVKKETGAAGARRARWTSLYSSGRRIEIAPRETEPAQEQVFGGLYTRPGPARAVLRCRLYISLSPAFAERRDADGSLGDARRHCLVVVGECRRRRERTDEGGHHTTLTYGRRRVPVRSS